MKCGHCFEAVVRRNFPIGTKLLVHVNPGADHVAEPGPNDEYELRCICGARETISVEFAFDIYGEMNKKSWALIPTQHGRIVQGVCPDCRMKQEGENYMQLFSETNVGDD